MRVISLDDLSPTGIRVYEFLYENSKTRRGQCSREDYAAGFLDLAANAPIAAYWKPEVLAEIKATR